MCILVTSLGIKMLKGSLVKTQIYHLLEVVVVDIYIIKGIQNGCIDRGNSIAGRIPTYQPTYLPCVQTEYSK